MNVFGKRLRERARELDLTDAEVARRAGLNERRYGHYVTNMREPDLNTLVRICTVLGTTPNYLLDIAEGESALQGREISPDEQERKTQQARLMAAGNALEPNNLRLAVKQIEALVRHQRAQKGGK